MAWGKDKKRLKNKGLTAILDADWPKYTVAAAGEKRSILVTHKGSGRTMEFDTRSEFWGRGKAITGWLGNRNQEMADTGKKLFTREDFDVEDVQTPEPIENVLHSAKLYIDKALKALGTKKYRAYLGKGDSFRVGLSTLMEYKGNRKDLLKPLHLDSVEEYIQEKFNAEIITGIEADDKVVIEAYGRDDCVVVGIDKDMYSQPVKVFNPDRPEEGVIDCDCFGKLWLKGSGSNEKVRGYGRLHLLFQMISQDTADNYKFNTASSVRWGAKAAYKALVDCKNDQEAWDAVLEATYKVYPKPVEFTTWRGTGLVIDGWYVLNEMFDMVRMKTHDNDFTTLEVWLEEHNIENKYRTVYEEEE